MNFLFYLFSSLALISGSMVIQARNPVHSVLFLILVFFNAAALLLLLGLDFFAMIFLVVYVGAIAVLFLFVVMMLNIKLAEIHEKKLRYLPIGGLLGILFLLEILLIVDNDLIPFIIPVQTGGIESFGLSSINPGALQNNDVTQQTEGLQPFLLQQGTIYSSHLTEWSGFVKNLTSIEGIGSLIYTYYFYFFLLASLILLVAMIGAIVLTMHKNVHVRRQDLFLQNTREFTKTIRKVS